MKRTTVAKSAAALGVVSLLLAACGGGSESASEASPTAGAASPTADGSACANPTLVIGSLLPQTGDLAFLGPPEFAGVDLALKEIDAAGGVLGQPVTYFEGDSGDTTTDTASQTVDSHLSQGVQAIIGAASSGVSLTVIDKITSNGVLQMSPANTSPALTTYEDNGLYFRVAPSDALQGAVLADQAINAGFTKAAVIARQDSYGDGLKDAFAKNFEANGGTVTAALSYDPAATTFEAEVSELKAGDPEAIVIVGFEETTKLMQEMIKQGVGPQDAQLYLVDGNLSATAFAEFPAGIMKGVLGTVPSGDSDLTAFNQRLLEVDPSLQDFTYGAQSYDAATVIALAAQYAGCADGAAIAAALPKVANEGGEKCTDYASCLALLNEGKEIDFDGVTGPLDFNEYGDMKYGTISINEYSDNTTFAEIDRVTAEVPLP